jgi:hypothetical protein
MNELPERSGRTGPRLLAVSGACALAVLGVLGVHYGTGPAGGPSVLAGSGDAPTNTVYVQPVVGEATMGATATTSTPGPVPEIPSAAPAVKAK